MELKNKTLCELIDSLKAQKITSEDIYAYFQKRVEEKNSELNAFITLPRSFSEAKKDRGAQTFLPALPIASKDLFCEKGITTTAASKMLENFIPPYESTVTARLKEAGFVTFGKTNLDEFAMGGSGENSAMGTAKNPWDPSRVAGGSSSGSAVAVAAGLVPAALGTDTGGSIRQPASMCGIVGFKPGYGRNSRSGVIAMASSLDCPGYLTRSVRDAGLLYEITAGHDPKDATSLCDPVTLDSNIWEHTDLKGIRVGIPKEYFTNDIDAGVRETIESAIKKAETLGAEIVPISLEHTKEGVAVYYVICPAEVASNMARYDGIRFGKKSAGTFNIASNRSEGLGEEVKRRSLVGSFVLSSGFYDAYYKKASTVRELIRKDFSHAFEQVDVIFAPTAPNVAWKIGEKAEDPIALYMEDVFTIPASLAGIPGLVIPVGLSQAPDDASVELPVGMQILGAIGAEERVLQVGHVLEQALAPILSQKTPKIW